MRELTNDLMPLVDDFRSLINGMAIEGGFARMINILGLKSE